MASGARVEFEPADRPGPSQSALAQLEERVQEAVERGVTHLLSIQAPEGYWLGELEADTTLESDYIYYLNVLGKADPQRISKLANYVRRRQLADGGWNIYFGGPAELNATVKAYFALKLAGDSAEAEHMVKAREVVHRLGGLEHTNSFTRFYLTLAGALGWEMVPAVPPELMLLPNWFYLNIYEMSSWSRGIVIPLAILYAHKPRWALSAETRVDELFRDPSRLSASFEWDRKQLFTWRNFFLALDRALKLYERLPWKPLRQRALRQARQWMLEHLERSEGLGAIYPAMMNAIFALLALGHGPDDPLTAREIRELARFEIEEGDTIRLQPCFSPVWDTAITMVALEEAGLPANHPALVRAADWLLDRQILGPGDWQVKNPSVPGGWVFEFRNEFYPDVDDTAFVLMALQRVDHPNRRRLEHAMRRGLAWLVSMQNRDGGWGAFDHNNDCRVFTQVPFADHNAMIDPSTADVTARVLECLGRFGWPATHPAIQRAVAFLLKDQTADGSWYGRWGVNYVYGTSGVLRSLETVSLAAREYCQRAVAWLRQVQNADGGFGESIASYYDASLKGRGRSTPSQTAWGLIGLLAASELSDPAIGRAVAHLVEQQKADGSWDEQEFTGTGFPCVFYLKYHLYRNYFPLYALARYRNLARAVPMYRGLEIKPQEIERLNARRERA
jgi:squalene-hopene/tetraprenyl-beta-curcumene cyclase